MTAATVRVEQLLAELGDTADAVADRLRALGIKGWRHKPSCCPVATYLRDRGIRANIAPDLEHGPRGDWYARIGRAQARHKVPEPVAEFARRFDRGVYLDLLAETWDAPMAVDDA